MKIPDALRLTRPTWPGGSPACAFAPLLALLLAVAGIAFAARADSPAAAPPAGQRFASPEAAVTALAEAARLADRAGLRQIFGLDDGLVAADQVQTTNELANFTAAFDVAHRLVRDADDRRTLEVGDQRWPFPIPLVRGTDGQWQFDTAAGRDEILNRRIGRNELEAIDVIRAYVDAQREYAARDRDGDDVLEFAARIRSSPGKKDGLYWPTELDGEISPLGPLFAHAQAEGYEANPAGEGPEPFHGYLFRILDRQGRHAAGGRYRYTINGHLIAGFALVAWPAQYGESGIMTFIVNQQGRILQKDLGPRTARTAAGMRSFDPDDSWHPAYSTAP